MAFKIVRRVELGPPADIERLNDLSLALVIPWPDGWPQYLGDVDTPQGRRWLLEMTKGERLPWEL
jgi:hypothetical protein